MQRLMTAPNLVLATLWADMLRQAGLDATVQRAYASSLAGELQPDLSLPEIWIGHDDDLAQAQKLLHELRNAPHRHWFCGNCQEEVLGPFEQCWACGAMRPGSTL
jgi:hypothetical protein